MKRLETSVEIQMPIEQVFEFLIEPSPIDHSKIAIKGML